MNRPISPLRSTTPLPAAFAARRIALYLVVAAAAIDRLLG